MAIAQPAAGQGTGNDLPLNPDWVNNTLSRGFAVGEAKNNTIEGAIERRDQAREAWQAANQRYTRLLASARKARKGTRVRERRVARARAAYPDPRSKPEYSVVWAGKQNAGDQHADSVMQFIEQATINPQGLADLAVPQYAPGLDGIHVIDVRKLNTDGSLNPDYGKVVNTVQLPMPWSIEAEPHHMQYEWNDGEPIVAGGLFNGANFIFDAKDIPNLGLQNIISQAETPGGSIVDAYDAVGDGRFIGTHMGGPVPNIGGSPGAVFTLKPDAAKGLVFESETPAGRPNGISSGNAGGVPEPCTQREARPLGTCANPHGIQIRNDMGTMITSDYAEPREIVLDPIKTIDKYSFRPTVRSWDVSNAAAPVLKSVARMPRGWRRPVQRAHENYGIMETAKTWGQQGAPRGTLASKGFFAGSMCGGGIFFNPDPSNDTGNSSDQWKQVWDDGLSQLLTGGQTTSTTPNEFIDDPGGCAGGAWHQVSRNNKWFFRAVQGRGPGSVAPRDQGSPKVVYNINIEPLIRSAADGDVNCDLTNGMTVDGKKLTAIQVVHKLATGERVGDCPYHLDGLNVKDLTTGGPHWAALDNHSITTEGFPTRLNFSNYFVSRTGVDGDHRYYTVDIDPLTGKMSYDREFRDEKTGAIGVDFNRRDWPGSPDAGFYKPHSMVFVCPPGVCPRNATNAALPPADGTTLRLVSSVRRFTTKLRGSRSARIRVVRTGGEARNVRILVRRGNRVVARSRTLSKMTRGARTFTIRRSKAMRRGVRYRVSVIGVDPSGKRVSGQTRSVRA